VSTIGITPSVSQTKRVALVIGSGSVKCAAALGLQRVLRREGIDVSLIVGCSGGALYAAATALGMTIEQATDLSLRLFTREATSKRDRRALLRFLFPKLLGFSEDFGMRDGRPIWRALHAVFGDREFSDTEIPLYIAATDFWTGEQAVLSRGRIIDAIRASIAIPWAFPPWRIDGRPLVDGYLSDPLPVNVAMREGADIILAMGFESPTRTSIDSPLRFAGQLTSIMTNNLLKSRFAFHNLSHHTEVIPIIPEFTRPIRLFDTDQIPYVIEEGERTAEAHMPFIRKLLTAEGPTG
jgi:NTE family protein